MKRGLCFIKMGDGLTKFLTLLNKNGEKLEKNQQIPLKIGRYHCLFYKSSNKLININNNCLDVREKDKYIGKPSLKEYFMLSTALLNQKNGEKQNNIGT